MTRLAKILISVLLLVVLSAANPGAQTDRDACKVIQQALADYGDLKTGMTRRDVSRHFIQDDGLQFASPTRYVHPKCNYLHVDVEFELVKPTEIRFSPEDRVVKVSKLYVEYPAKD